jgi:hypothetical protein
MRSTSSAAIAYHRHGRTLEGRLVEIWMRG